MAEAAVCYSIIEQMLNANAWISNDQNTKVAQRVNSHVMLISDGLLNYYEQYFLSKGKEYDQRFKTFIAANIGQKKAVRFLNEEEVHKIYSQKSPYINELLNVALVGNDKWVLSDLPEIKQQEINRQGLAKITTMDILQTGYDNLFGKYTLPIKKYNVGIGDDSKELAEWLGYFFKGEKNIILYDNYTCKRENVDILSQYILPYVDKGASVTIYTTIEKDSLSMESIKDEFSKSKYQDWTISVFWVSSKHDNHSRVILTDNYRIDLDRGIYVFGTKGKTNQCVVDIDYRNATSEFRFNGFSKQIV